MERETHDRPEIIISRKKTKSTDIDHIATVRFQTVGKNQSFLFWKKKAAKTQIHTFSPYPQNPELFSKSGKVKEKERPPWKGKTEKGNIPEITILPMHMAYNSTMK